MTESDQNSMHGGNQIGGNAGIDEAARQAEQMRRDGDDGSPELDIEELVGDEAPDPLLEASEDGVEFDPTVTMASDDAESEDGR